MPASSASAADNVATLPHCGVWGNSKNRGDANNGTAASGVMGTSTSGCGVSASSSTVGGTAAFGNSTGLSGNGVFGACNTGVVAHGVLGASSSGYCVYGEGPYGTCGTGTTTGVWGQNTAASGPANGAGVLGNSGGTYPGVLGTTDRVSPPTGVPAGVLGTGAHTGVLGLTTTATAAALGVQGVSVTTGSTTGYGVKGAVMNGAGSAAVFGCAPNGAGYGFYGYSTPGAAAGCLASRPTTAAPAWATPRCSAATPRCSASVARHTLEMSSSIAHSRL